MKKPRRSPTQTNPKFLQIMDAAIKQLGTQTALADVLGITVSRMSHIMTGRAGALGINKCLRLAERMGLPAHVVLDAAGHRETVELLRKTWGEELKPIPGEDMPEDIRQQVQNVLDFFSRAARNRKFSEKPNNQT